MDSAEMKRRVERSRRKMKYKELLDLGADLRLRAETTDPVETFQSVQGILAMSNALQGEGHVKDRAEYTTEVLMDAQVVKMSHELVQVAAQQHGNADFSDDQLVASIMSCFDADQSVENWEKITREAAGIFHMTKHQQSLYGTFDFDPVVQVEKVARQRSQRQRVDFGQAKKPETVQKLQKQEKSAQKLNVIYNQIIALVEQNGGVPIPYFQLILDPDDFMATVDNAFQLSFLIRDGRVALLSDQNHEPIVRAVSPKEIEQAKQRSESTQAILGLNPAKWRQLNERFRLTEPMLSMARENFDDDSQMGQSQGQQTGSSMQ